jgi:hypothetical protein
VRGATAAGKGLAGLDEHQVRRWTSWRRWTLLAMIAAILLVVLLAVVMLVVTFKGLAKMQTVKDVTDFLGVILSPLVGLVGAATGFYYAGGGKKD